MKALPEDKTEPAADDPRGLEFSGNSPGGITGAQHDEFLALGRDGRKQLPRQPAANGKGGEQHDSQKFAQINGSLDEKSVWGVSRWLLDFGSQFPVMSSPLSMIAFGIHPGLENQNGRHLVYDL